MYSDSYSEAESSLDSENPVETIANHHPELATRICLKTPFVGVCPHSGEPQAGSSIALIYTPKNKLLELKSWRAYLASFGHGDAKDLETVAQQIAICCAASLGVSVTIRASYVLADGTEMICVCRRAAC